jgi:hypothetical protein
MRDTEKMLLTGFASLASIVNVTANLAKLSHEREQEPTFYTALIASGAFAFVNGYMCVKEVMKPRGFVQIEVERRDIDLEKNFINK